MEELDTDPVIEHSKREAERLMREVIGGKGIPDLMTLLLSFGMASAPTAYPIYGKIQGFSEKAADFIEAYDDLPLGVGLNTAIHVLEKTDIDGKLGIFIEVGENTRHEKDLRPLIALALQWRDSLLEWQGSSDYGGFGFLKSLWERKQEGESYGQLAEYVNQQVAEYLMQFTELEKAYEVARPKFNGIDEAWQWVLKSRPDLGTNPSALDQVIYILRSMRFSDKKVVEIIQTGLFRIKQGEQPFYRDEPVTYQKMAYTLRYWFKKRDEISTSKPPRHNKSNN